MLKSDDRLSDMMMPLASMTQVRATRAGSLLAWQTVTPKAAVRIHD